MTEKKLQQLIERDIMQLKLLLKFRAASYSVIRDKEKQHIHHFHDLLQTVKLIQDHLRRELSAIQKLRKRQERNHKIQRWNIIHATLTQEIETFHQALRDRKNFVDCCKRLHTRLHTFDRLLRTAQRKTLKAEEFRLLRAFSKEPLLTHARDQP